MSWIKAILGESVSFTLVTLSRFFKVRKSGGVGRPILLVHGYINFSSVWLIQKRWLEKAGFGPIYAIDLGHPFHTIEQYAAKVETKAKEIAQETGRSDLSLIGHSMGGLVSTYYAGKLAPMGFTVDVIALGSPFEGTPVARIGLGGCARQMQPNSQFLKELTALIEAKQLKVKKIAAKRDQIVIPGISAAGKDGIVINDIGHASLLYSRRVSRQLITWLSDRG